MFISASDDGKQLVLRELASIQLTPKTTRRNSVLTSVGEGRKETKSCFPTCRNISVLDISVLVAIVSNRASVMYFWQFPPANFICGSLVATI